jgi:hypothetical protein
MQTTGSEFANVISASTLAPYPTYRTTREHDGQAKHSHLRFAVGLRHTSQRTIN